ncbi:DNA integrity scanning protein DisA [Heliorestis acidaminivorans]|uniref:DNA integrity scanning protein DisA n=1 Tax=Heliorestis acidaminivorans TaxID=553427 RepID=A0A6I0EXV9_9FIRM|nr:DNA integrity scanning diadenylate cyclase DisA [Heliorestis acidaminivorans]KAB2951442.1 DNA integrity scanning protein DisA [Heliorestis acidaminivorans]
MVKEPDEKFLQALRALAPGSPLREGLENIMRAKTGALIVIGDSPQVLELVEGGFLINCPYTPAALYELAKMDGSIVLNHDGQKILYANTQLVPEPTIPSAETGIRHRTAERVARQTGEMVISISQRRGVITIYQGAIKYTLRDIATILTKANQGLQTLEKYKVVIDKALTNLTALEFEDLVTVFDVTKIIQRIEMFTRMVQEMDQYIIELGKEGRLVTMQLTELTDNVEEQAYTVIEDYLTLEGRSVMQVREEIRHISNDIPDLVAIAKSLGYGTHIGVLDMSVSSRGYRILEKIPRLPHQVVHNLVANFGGLQNVMTASIEELDEVEGIGEVRARAIKEGLRRLREQLLLDRDL